MLIINAVLQFIVIVILIMKFVLGLCCDAVSQGSTLASDTVSQWLTCTVVTLCHRPCHRGAGTVFHTHVIRATFGFITASVLRGSECTVCTATVLQLATRRMRNLEQILPQLFVRLYNQERAKIVFISYL